MELERGIGLVFQSLTFQCPTLGSGRFAEHNIARVEVFSGISLS